MNPGMSNRIDNRKARFMCLISGLRNGRRRGHSPALRINGHNLDGFIGYRAPIAKRCRLRRFEFGHVRQPGVARRIARLGG